MIDNGARIEFLELAVTCGATITGKPDGSEPVSVVFTPEAWQKFDAACVVTKPVAKVTKGSQYGPGLVFLANGQNLPEPGTLLYSRHPATVVMDGPKGAIVAPAEYPQPPEAWQKFDAANKLLMDAIQEVIGCFTAAEIEGLTSVLQETSDERLKDLVERRLMYALKAAQGVINDRQ